MENLTASSTWRSRHISPSDVLALRRRWPKAVFQVMKERGTEMERLRRQAYRRPEWVYRHAQPGCCPVCKTMTESSLESHMMCCHLDLGQLWRCPVEWCAVWKGSVRECLEHFNDKHSGSATLDFENVSRSFPPWTVPRDLGDKGTSAGSVGHSSGCEIVPRSGKAAGTQIPGVQRPTTTSGNS